MRNSLLIQIGLLFGGLGLAPAAVAAQSVDAIKVDFAQDGGPVTHIGSGMLQSVSIDQPEAKYIEPLKMRSWRLDGGHVGQLKTNPFDLYDRLKSMGVVDIYYDLSGMGMEKGPDREAWFSQRDAAIKSIVERAQREKKDFIYDVYNEPNTKLGNAADSLFVDEPDWFEVWDRTYRSLRSADPNAKTMGPSYGWAKMDLPALLRFVDHCIAAHTMPPIIDWHFGGLETYDAVAKAIRARAKAAGYDVQLLAGEAVPAGTDINLDAGYPAYLFAVAERQNMENIHATWTSSPMVGEAQAYAAELAGLVTREKKVPRGVWWTYESYGEMNGRMVPVSAPIDGPLDGVASTNLESHTAMVLIGTRNFVGGVAKFELSHLDVAGIATPNKPGVRVQIFRIPSTEVDLAAPLAVSDTTMRLSKQGDLSFEAAVGERESVLVRLSPGDAAAAKPPPVEDLAKLKASDALLYHRSATLQSFEAEDVPVDSRSNVTHADSKNASDGIYSVVALTKSGDTATYKLALDQTRDAILWLRYVPGKDEGIVTVSLDGKPLCGPLDFYLEKHQIHEVRCAAANFTQGTHSLTFTAVGKNGKSSGYAIGLDAVRLATVDGQTAFSTSPVPGSPTALLKQVFVDNGVRVDLPAVTPGKYNVDVAFSCGGKQGRFSLLLDGVPIGLTHSGTSCKAAAVTPTNPESDFGSAFVGSGAHQLMFVPQQQSGTMDPAFHVSTIVLRRYKE